MSYRKLEEIAIIIIVSLIWALVCFPAEAYIAQVGILETFGKYAYIQTGKCKIEQITIINLDRGENELWKFREPGRLKWADTLRANADTWFNAVVMKGCK